MNPSPLTIKLFAAPVLAAAGALSFVALVVLALVVVGVPVVVVGVPVIVVGVPVLAAAVALVLEAQVADVGRFVTWAAPQRPRAY